VLETIVNASTSKSAYKCDSCKKLTVDSFSKSNQNEAISAELQCTASCIADKVSLSSQLETVCANGICTMEMVQSMVAMVSKHSSEMNQLRTDNETMKMQLREL
jgi:hypothetical protein